MVVSSENRGSCASSSHLTGPVLNLLKASMSPSSRRSYMHSWTLLLNFAPSSISLPLPVVLVCNFIGDLFQKSYSPSTISSHVSALSYVHKILGMPDPTTSFLVSKLLKGCRSLRQSHDSRLPITKEILHKLIISLPKCIADPFNRLLLKSHFLACIFCIFTLR